MNNAAIVIALKVLDFTVEWMNPQHDCMHCYLCGRLMQSDATYKRRRVRVGERIRTVYRSGKRVESVASYGIRVVCQRCAHFLDKQKQWDEVIKSLAALGVLFALTAFLWFSK